MANPVYIVPGQGLIQDTEDGSSTVLIAPGQGLFQLPDAAAGGAVPLLVGGCMGSPMGSNCNLMTG